MHEQITCACDLEKYMHRWIWGCGGLWGGEGSAREKMWSGGIGVKDDVGRRGSWRRCCGGREGGEL